MSSSDDSDPLVLSPGESGFALVRERDDSWSKIRIVPFIVSSTVTKRFLKGSSSQLTERTEHEVIMLDPRGTITPPVKSTLIPGEKFVSADAAEKRALEIVTKLVQDEAARARQAAQKLCESIAAESEGASE